jgi:hypothetical protein
MVAKSIETGTGDLDAGEEDRDSSGIDGRIIILRPIEMIVGEEGADSGESEVATEAVGRDVEVAGEAEGGLDEPGELEYGDVDGNVGVDAVGAEELLLLEIIDGLQVESGAAKTTKALQVDELVCKGNARIEIPPGNGDGREVRGDRVEDGSHG